MIETLEGRTWRIFSVRMMYRNERAQPKICIWGSGKAEAGARSSNAVILLLTAKILFVRGCPALSPIAMRAYPAFQPDPLDQRTPNVRYPTTCAMT